jgi:hypothetical protein
MLGSCPCGHSDFGGPDQTTSPAGARGTSCRPVALLSVDARCFPACAINDWHQMHSEEHWDCSQAHSTNQAPHSLHASVIDCARINCLYPGCCMQQALRTAVMCALPGRFDLQPQMVLAGIAVHPAIRLSRAHWEVEQRAPVTTPHAPLCGSLIWQQLLLRWLLST